VLRTAFFNYGAGYLSVFAFSIRIYSAVRFILIDSFIGSKLANWKVNLQHEQDYLQKMLNLTLMGLVIVLTSLLISTLTSTYFIYSCIQIALLLMSGFYFSTLVRIIYFKINRHQNNSRLVIQFAVIEFICLSLAVLLTKQANYPLLTLLWIGYIAKPFGQLLLLRKYYRGLTAPVTPLYADA